jgi:uncharacterized protein
MQKVLKTVFVLGLLLTLSGCFGSDEEKLAEVDTEPVATRLNIAIGKMAGVNYAAGKAICVALKKNGSELPCKLMATKSSKQNLTAIDSGHVDLALVRADTAYQAWHGHQPYKKRYTKSRVLFSLHHELVTLLVKEEANILSFMGIDGKAINIGPANSDNGRLILDLLKRCQIPVGDNFSREENGSLTELFAKKTVQGGIDLLIHPEDDIKTLANDKPLQFLPITGHCIEQLVDEVPYLDRVYVPGGLYKGLPSKLPTIGAKIWLIANSDLPDSATYEIVKAVFAEVKQFQRSDPAFYRLSSRKMLSSFVIPYHVGAVKYFQEKGWYQERR